ncbi:MAG: 4-hydroxy-tetrahydrodipicolinate reductase [Candidatus Velthaea sp.]
MTRAVASARTRVGVAGAFGRLGSVAVQAVSAAPDLELVAGFERVGDYGAAFPVFDDLDAFYRVPMDVVVDATVCPISHDVARGALAAGVSPVIGVSGWTDDDWIAFATAVDDAGIGAIRVPNFSLGAVLMMHFAAEAARFLPHVEIIELHHETKLDAPSGTARMTAQRITQAGGPAHVPIHSVRLPGFVAHQETIFGGPGETLTIRHDSTSRDSFAGGILLAVRNVRAHTGLVTGLDALLLAGAPA